MLVQPHAGCNVDAKNGPHCTAEPIRQIHGEITAVMNLVFETWEAPQLSFVDVPAKVTKKLPRVPYIPGKQRSGDNPDADPSAKKAGNSTGGILFGAPIGGLLGGALAAANAASEDAQNTAKRMLVTPALLSNRWKMSFHADEESHLLVQEISGEAVFRMDVLNRNGLTADQLRSQLWHPIPFGYERLQPLVEGNELGDGIRYKIRDRQIFMAFPGGADNGIMSIEVVQSASYRGYDVPKAG
jgi:hypothetical protein